MLSEFAKKYGYKYVREWWVEFWISLHVPKIRSLNQLRTPLIISSERKERKIILQISVYLRIKNLIMD